MSVTRGASAQARIAVEIRPGLHVNTNKPLEDYLIPLRLTWLPGALQAREVVFPKAELQKFPFSEKPLAVYTGKFEILTEWKAPTGAAAGMGMMVGKLRYQACSNSECYPPKTVDVPLPFEIR